MEDSARASRAAYEAIVNAFQSKPDTALEIEILPPAIAPPEGCIIFHEGINVGIPKKALVAAFLAATRIFKKRSEQATLDRPEDAFEVSLLVPQFLMSTSTKLLIWFRSPF